MQVICLPKSPLGFREKELCGVWSIYSVTWGTSASQAMYYSAASHWPTDSGWTISAARGVRNISHASPLHLCSNNSAFPPKAAQWGENPCDTRGHLKWSRHLLDIELILRTEAHKHATYPANTHIQTAYTQKMPLIHIHTKIVFDDNKSGVDFM